MKKISFIILILVISCKQNEDLLPCVLETSVVPEELVIDNPNIILLLVDDLRYDALRYVQDRKKNGRFPYINTPNIDYLASQSTEFVNSFVPISLCSPSRASILTGSYPNQHGITGNQQAFKQFSFVNLLQSRGIETVCFGKWHMGQQAERPGFSKSYSYIGQGDYVDPTFLVNGLTMKKQGWVDDISTNFVLKELDEVGASQFFYLVGFKTSHSPWNVAHPEVAGSYRGFKSGSVPNLYTPAPYLNEDYSDARSPESYWEKFGMQDQIYLENITALDSNIGRILGKLKELSLEKETVIILTSDNGMYHGEHYLRDKRTAYEESIRVPLLIKYGDKKTVRQVEDLTINLDLAPTVLDMTRISCWGLDLEGISLLPSIYQMQSSKHEDFVFQYFEQEKGPNVSIQCLRTERYKYIHYASDMNVEDEIYDITNDPFELDNIVRDDELRKDLHSRLQERGNEIDLTIF